MINLFLFTSLLFLMWSIRNILFWVALWQLKEYRFDRVLIHIRETGQGKNLVFSPLSLLKWIGVFGYIYIIFYEDMLLFYQLFVAAIYVIEFLFISREIVIKLVKRPVFTAKALFIIVVAFFIISLLYVLPLMEPFFWILIIDRLTAVIIAFFVFCLSFPTEIQRDIHVQKAINKLSLLQKTKKKPLLIIGVTGSYGKSSTKDYVAQILSERFQVVKTRGTNNTPIGIAHTILTDVQNDSEIFVVEMGAYKIGEIAGICRMVKPQIGILTAVNDQHLSLFGSLQNTMSAKYELIDSLPKNGLALFNGNNEHAYHLAKNTKKPHILYAVTDENGETPRFFDARPDAGILAEQVVVGKNDVRFRVRTKDDSFDLRAPLLGAHTIENILPGVFVALHLGMRVAEIRRAVGKLVPIEKTMIRKTWKKGISLIDDTFNANPQSALAAASYLRVYGGKKFYVLQPMIELGTKAIDEHYKVAKKVLETCDFFLLTNKNFSKAIVRAEKEVQSSCVVQTDNASNLASFIAKHAKHGDVVVFEGKEAAFVMEKLLKE